MADIGIVIVTFNSEAEIGACLDAAAAACAEIVVVDNASSDGTLAETARRGIRAIANSSNRGFAAAANQGFAALSHCPYVLLLNPDAVLASSLEPLRAACAQPGVAAAGGCLLDSQGRPQVGFMVRRFPTPAALVAEALLLNRIWPRNPINRRYRELDLDPSAPREVQQPAGALLMVRHAVWREIGGFAEEFFPLWFEDVDFCFRAARRGYRLRYVPEVVAKHTGAHSISHLTVEMRQFYWYGSLLRYSARHFRPIAFRIVSLAVVTGSFLRMMAESVYQRSLKPVAVYGKVVRFAGRCLIFGWGDGAPWSRTRS
ncbi:MAG TPA: glycosyltransferase family 2 protein [Bryobacteraceae bacterium]|nr:glycosyltransferase family 2 protein [Bryobacteraceae bacterium]